MHQSLCPARNVKTLLTSTRRNGEWRSDLAILTFATDGSMHGEHIVDVPYGDVELFVAHLDGDGVLDILLATGRQPLRVASLLGRRGGGFTAPEWAEIATFSPAANLRLSDIDRDDRLDLVDPFARGGVLVYAGLGGGRFQSQRLWSDLICAQSATIGDVNDDSFTDLACARPDGLFLGLGTPSGTLGGPQSVLSEAQVVTSADLDGDGRIEIVAMSSDRAAGAEYNKIFVGQNSGGDFVFDEYAYPGPMPVSIDVVDMNDDGVQDLVLGGEGHISIVHQRH